MPNITIRHTSECSYFENGNWCNCGAVESLKTLEAMTHEQFEAFFDRLPARVQLMVRGGLMDWREALPQWYKKLNTSV